jgi:exopolysaccharide biosynthesis polyprenyl glycosylphosphotransferase
VNWLDRYLARLVITDALALAAASVITLSFGPHPPTEPLVSRILSGPYWAVLLVGMALWLVVAVAMGAYDRGVLGEGYEEFRRVVLTTAAWLGVITLIAFATVTQLSRAAVLWMVVLVGLLSLLGRDANRRWLHARRAEGLGVRRVLVHGTVVQAERLATHLATAPWSGYRVVAVSGPDDEQLHLDLDDPHAALSAAGADTLAVADASDLGPDGLRTLAERLEGSGCELLVVPTLTEVAGPRIRIRPVSGLPLLHLEEPRLTGPARLAKAGIDRALSALLLVVLAIPLGVLALVVRLTTPGPAFFAQVRIGQDGREFTMYKLRSMVDGAEERRHELDDNDADGPLFKLRDDPRVTRVGGWLRRHSLDELPQLWNVLRGEMSLVGPRPMLPSEVADLSGRASRRLLVKPGITGLWQVSGRSEVAWADAVRLDLYYVENWSLSLDLVIMLRTALTVLQGRGAY